MTRKFYKIHNLRKVVQTLVNSDNFILVGVTGEHKSGMRCADWGILIKEDGNILVKNLEKALADFEKEWTPLTVVAESVTSKYTIVIP